jgi:hypothetical protein
MVILQGLKAYFSQNTLGIRSDRHFQKALSRGGTFGGRGLGMPMPPKFVWGSAHAFSTL